MKKTILTGVITLLLITPIVADEIENKIAQGLNAYKNKEYKKAADILRDTANEMEELVVKESTSFSLPSFGGWSMSTEN